MVRTIHDCLLVLSDSGGIQEEAPVLGKRVVVLRDTTERPEPVDAGINILAGSNPQKIVAATEEILKKLPASPVKCFTGFGLGNSAQQILDILSQDHSERNNG
jgi:UDP-N-acetylglucosamine 2-epimerase (non-hydrolysing)